MNDAEFAARTREVLAEEAVSPEQWWWLSFADASGFLGVAIVRAHGILSAATKARHLGINPGGDVRGYAIPEVERIAKNGIVNRLLSKDEALALSERWIK